MAETCQTGLFGYQARFDAVSLAVRTVARQHTFPYFLGELGDNFYVVEAGEFDIYVKQEDGKVSSIIFFVFVFPVLVGRGGPWL